MTAQLCPLLIFREWDNNGNPLVNGQLFTYQAGTTTPQATYVDSTQTTPNTNPVILNSRGEAAVWLNPALTYKFVLQDSFGNFIWSQDQVPGGYVTIAQFNPITPAETSAGVVPVNFQYPAYTPDRYITNGQNVDMWQAIFNADKAANIAGAAVNFLPGSLYGINPTAHGAALTISSSWICNGGTATIQRQDFTASVPLFMAIANQVNNLVIRGLVFDGQVTTVAAGNVPNVDLGAPGSYADNATESLWTQVYGPRFIMTQNCTIEDCTFKNFLRAGLRIDSGQSGVSASGPPWPQTISLGNRVINCKTIRSRGIFGDGFYNQDVENIQYVNCYAYDYQRIGYDHEFGTYGSNGVQMTNCVADFGHDAVTSGAQSNVGFWIESGDGVSYANCESKNTSVGFQSGVATNPSAGLFRPWTGGHTYTGCRATRCNSAGFKMSLGTRDAHVSYQGCLAEVNSTAATYSGSVGIGSNGFQVVALPGGSPPDGTGGVNFHIEIKDCHVDLVAMAATSGGNPLFNAAAVNMWNCAVTNAQQLQVDIIGLSTKWLSSAGANDPNVPGTYELTTGHNYGYFGDITFTGLNNGGSQFTGKARIKDCTNQTTGYVMISSEINGTNSVLEVANTMCSLRTGGFTSNLGLLNLSNCELVDYRGNIGFAEVKAVNCFFADADSGNTDRTLWGSNTLNAAMFYFANCRFQRRMLFLLGTGTTSNRAQNLKMTGCEFFLQLPYSGGGENFITLSLPGGAFGSVDFSSCSFRNVGGKSSATGSMIVNNTNGTLQVNGAGNSYDNGYVSGGGHVIQYNSTPTFNDAPGTAAAPFNLVNGFLQQWNAA